jgi:hypothetical protein
MSRERYKQSVFVSTDVRPGRVGHPCITTTGFSFFALHFPTGSAVDYVVSSLRDFRRNRIASLPKLLQAAGGQVR